jgi:hypothetical protein
MKKVEVPGVGDDLLMTSSSIVKKEDDKAWCVLSQDWAYLRIRE